MKKLLLSVAALVGLLVGLGFIMPAVALWRDQGALHAGGVWPVLGGVILMLAGLAAGVTALRPQRR